VQPPAFQRDGHGLFSNAGVPVWGTIAATVLDKVRELHRAPRKINNEAVRQ
jgi:hypothetical protein